MITTKTKLNDCVNSKRITHTKFKIRNFNPISTCMSFYLILKGNKLLTFYGFIHFRLTLNILHAEKYNHIEKMFFTASLQVASKVAY